MNIGSIKKSGIKMPNIGYLTRLHGKRFSLKGMFTKEERNLMPRQTRRLIDRLHRHVSGLAFDEKNEVKSGLHEIITTHGKGNSLDYAKTLQIARSLAQESIGEFSQIKRFGKKSPLGRQLDYLKRWLANPTRGKQILKPRDKQSFDLYSLPTSKEFNHLDELEIRQIIDRMRRDLRLVVFLSRQDINNLFGPKND